MIQRMVGNLLRWRLLAMTAYRVIQVEGPLAFLKQTRRWLAGEREYYRQLKPLLPDYMTFYTAVEPSADALDDQREQCLTWDKPHFDILIYGQANSQATRTSLDMQTYSGYTIYEIKQESIPDPTGDFVLPIEAGDCLAPHALYTLAARIRDEPGIEVIYADQDRIESDGQRCDPWFKPSPFLENALSANPLLQACAFHRSIWSRAYLDNPYEFTLKLLSNGINIHQTPGVLLHRSGDRTIPSVDTRVLCDHLRNMGLDGLHTEKQADGTVFTIWQPAQTPMISVVIPSKNKLELISRCLESLFSQTQYPAYEVIVVDNGSTDPAVLTLYDHYAHSGNFQVVAYNEPFNFSRACNLGAQQARGDVLLFLNNDTEILHRDWLTRMVRWFDLPDVGIVGAKLLYPDGTVQHAGVVLGLVSLAEHLFALAPEGTSTLYGTDNWYRSVTAVTGACLMIRRASFEAIGGFDEGYRLIYSDIDLCVQAYERGLRTIYTPDVRLVHQESMSHRRRIPMEDVARAYERMGKFIRSGDPYYHPHLTTEWPVPDFKRTSQLRYLKP